MTARAPHFGTGGTRYRSGRALGTDPVVTRPVASSGSRQTASTTRKGCVCVRTVSTDRVQSRWKRQLSRQTEGAGSARGQLDREIRTGPCRMAVMIRIKKPSMLKGDWTYLMCFLIALLPGNRVRCRPSRLVGVLRRRRRPRQSSAGQTTRVRRPSRSRTWGDEEQARSDRRRTSALSWRTLLAGGVAGVRSGVSAAGSGTPVSLATAQSRMRWTTEPESRDTVRLTVGDGSACMLLVCGTESPLLIPLRPGPGRPGRV